MWNYKVKLHDVIERLPISGPKETLNLGLLTKRSPELVTKTEQMMRRKIRNT